MIDGREEAERRERERLQTGARLAHDAVTHLTKALELAATAPDTHTTRGWLHNAHCFASMVVAMIERTG